MTGPEFPLAEVRLLCGVCGDVLDHDGDLFTCEGCQLFYADIGFSRGERVDPTRPVCSSPSMHVHIGVPVRKGRKVWDCYPCQLTAGHTSPHWHGCTVHWEVAS